LDGILESSLYVEDVERSVHFYESVMGFRVMTDLGGRGTAMEAGPRQVLLLFRKRASIAIETPHDGDGELHVAFAIAAEDLQPWETWLREQNIEIEDKKTWSRSGQSLYFRDPDRHLLELATPGVWPNY